MKYIALYPRVSTQEQAKEGYSIDEQIERLKNYCKAMGWKQYKVYTDAGYSGGNMNRPALQEMIKDIEAGNIEKVVVYKLDRLSRSQKDTLNLIEDVFLANGVDFVSMLENFDTSTSFGRAMVGILAVFAQLEREQIKERMSMGREGRAKEGKFHGGGYAPVGYDYIDGELIVNEFEKMQILEIYERFLNGSTINNIVNTFCDKGFRHKYGMWHYKSVKNVLSNPVYIGQVTFDGHTYEGKQTPIIDNDSFEKAQKIIEDRAEANVNYQRKNYQRTNYLAGLLSCKHCGGKYGAAVQYRNFPDGRKYKYNYYCCYSRRKQCRNMVVDPNCKNKNYRMKDLDDIIFGEIKKLALQPEHITEIQQRNYSEEEQRKAAIIQAEIESINAQRSRLMDLYGLGQYTIEEIQAKTQPLNDQREKLTKELQSLTASKSSMTKNEVIEIVDNFSTAIEQGTFEEIRLLIESLIDNIEIDNENITIKWKFA